MKNILNFFTYIVIVAGIVFGLPKLLSHYLNTPYPMAAITSGSMWPALKEGDLVFIQGVEPEQMKVGDIVVFRDKKNSHFVIHRVTKINDKTKTFVTKGDANFSEDEPSDFADLVGQTFEIKGKSIRIPYLGSITVFASNFKEEKKMESIKTP